MAAAAAMHCGECRELTAAHIDGLLPPDEEVVVAAHIATCPACSLLVERERQFAQSLRGRNLIRLTPLEVRERVLASIEAHDRSLGWTARLRQWWGRPLYRTALAGALAVVVVALALPVVLRFRAPRGNSLLNEVLANYRAVQTEATKLEVQTDKPKVLELYFAQKGIQLPVRTVIDLRALGFKLVGGSVVALGGATSAMMLYRGERGWVLCHRFRAADLQLPPDGEVVDKNTYYTIGDLSVCAYRDGDAVCLMASAMSRADLKKLLAGYV
jgi:anti-sigma factor RsiW